MMKSTVFLIHFLLMCCSTTNAQSSLESAYADFRAASAVQPQTIMAGYGKHYAVESFRELKTTASTLVSALEQERNAARSEKNRLETETNRLKADILTLRNQNSIEYVAGSSPEPAAVQPQRRPAVAEPIAAPSIIESSVKTGGFNEWVSNNYLMLIVIAGMGYFFYNQHLQKKKDSQ